MAAMLVDLPLAPVPSPAPLSAAPSRWVHVGSPRPAGARPVSAPPARPSAPARPGGRPQGVPAPRLSRRPATARVALTPPATAPLRLTDRGLAVVIGGFALVMVTALVVLVAAFWAVPNEPMAAQLLLG